MTTDGRRLGLLDRGLYALFAHHADDSRHSRTRERYREANPDVGFGLYVARLYALSWAVSLASGALITSVAVVLPPGVLDTVATVGANSVPVLDRIGAPSVPRVVVAVVAGVVTAGLARWAVLGLGSRYLTWVATARRADIEATLPGAVRYLRVLAAGSHDQRAVLRAVAEQEAYGETAVAFRRALNRAELTGSLDEGLERVATETPSRDLLAPFLLKFREHANQSTEALEGYLEMEGRLLSHQQSRRHERATGYLELLAELFVVLLILPALVVLIVTVMSVLAPGLSRPVSTPVGSFSTQAVVVAGSAAFVLAAGALSAAVVVTLRPHNAGAPSYSRPDELVSLLVTAPSNPASATAICIPFGAVVAAGLWALGYAPLNVTLLTYAAVGFPIGVVSIRRARLDDAKDREIQDFVHAVAGHVALGRPFPAAVKRVARDVELGALADDVRALAFALELGDSPEDAAADRRAAALDQFVDRVGTPLAEQTVGLVVGALDAGSDAEEIFETLQTEIGKLYHQRKALRSALLVYVAVGWTTAVLVVCITVAVNVYVLERFAQLSAVTGGQSIALNPAAIDPARARQRFYLVTQATMVSCGWFAGTASRGVYEALLHSSLLVVLGYVVYAGVGLL